ncbi:hypothetical protein [Azospirillum sp. sgz302134]
MNQRLPLATTAAIGLTAAPILTSAGLVDPVAAWQALSPTVRDQIGAAAIAHALGIIGSYQGLAPEPGWHAADAESLSLMEELLRDHLPAAFSAEDVPVRPDLGRLGIATCRECGCTDRCGCPEGCHWAEPDLCSVCAERRGE